MSAFQVCLNEILVNKYKVPVYHLTCRRELLPLKQVSSWGMSRNRKAPRALYCDRVTGRQHVDTQQFVIHIRGEVTTALNLTLSALCLLGCDAVLLDK